jgi:lysozyme
MTRRQPSAVAHALIERYERTILFTYDDDANGKRLQPGAKPKGKATIGRGNTRHALPAREITFAEAEAYYEEDCQDVLNVLYRFVPFELLASMPQQCFDALFSFIFNVGPQAFRDPKTGKPTNFIKALLKDLALVPSQMRRWVYDNGKRLAGLEARRESEATLWQSGLSAQHVVSGKQAAPAAAETRIVPSAPVPAIEQGPLLERPSTGAATTAAGTAGAVATETAQQMSLVGSTGHVIQLICLVLVLLGAGLTIYAIVKQKQHGKG